MSEYIKKSELFDKTIKRNSIWNEVTNSEGKGLEEIVNSLPTYSFPNSTEEGSRRIEHGTDGNAYVMSMSSVKEFEEDNTEWVDNGADDFECHCKKCGQEIFKVQKWFKFCPNCGRRAVSK